MKLIINKFPPITQPCEIDLSKKVILFVGKNNSGKTYLSQLIWGIYKVEKEYFSKWNSPEINYANLDKIALDFVSYLKKYTVKYIFKREIDIDFMIEFTLEELQSKNYSNSIFLPSTRLFFPSFYKYIFHTEKNFKDNMFENLDKINSENRNFYAPSYTQPVDELIKKLIFGLDKPMEKKSNYLNILSSIIEGDISVDRAEEIGMADISYKHKSGHNIPMYLSSSMVNQLSMLYLYFKYWCGEENNFLLLDEPEMNLHPSKKIEVMELLLDFASNNKLLIATHSSTLAKSLINYLHLFDLKEKKENMQEFIDENELDMNLDINLKSNDIGIYAFNGKTIVSYKQDDNSDIHFGTFTKVEELQNRQFDYIMEELDKYDS